MTKALFVFRRDFTLEDNLALNDLIETIDKKTTVYPIFIFDPFQVNKTKENKDYRSDNAIQFMVESLHDLDKQLSGKLSCFYGDPVKIIKKILEKNSDIKYMGFNRDFSEYANKRDTGMIEVCEELGVTPIVNYHFMTLFPIDEGLRDRGDSSNSGTRNVKPYKVFGSFKKNAPRDIAKPTTKRHSKYSSMKSNFKLSSAKKFYKENDELLRRGGRDNALKMISTGTLKKFKDYNKKRNFLDYQTTEISAYLKFGCITIREAYHQFKKVLGSQTDLLKQLYWRNYYFTLGIHHFNGYGHLDTKRWNNFNWKNSLKENKRLWDSADTGFPLIDASVRQLQATGFMNNRGRLIVANFAIKIMRSDPFRGYYAGQNAFSRMLYDNCWANNRGNWLWSLGDYDFGGKRFGRKGTFGGRIFKEILDIKKVDPQLKFIREWIPELDSVPDEDLVRWHRPSKKYPNGHCEKYADVKGFGYPQPMLDFNERIEEWYSATKL